MNSDHQEKSDRYGERLTVVQDAEEVRSAATPALAAKQACRTPRLGPETRFATSRNASRDTSDRRAKPLG